MVLVNAFREMFPLPVLVAFRPAILTIAMGLLTVPNVAPVKYKFPEFEMVPEGDEVIGPLAVMDVAPPARMVPNCKALASPNCTSKEPELFI